MKNKGALLTVILISIVMFSFLAYAAGTSTGNDGSQTVRKTMVKANNTNALIMNRTIMQNKSRFINMNCEVQSNVSSRIECRLEQRGVKSINVTEESCRVLANPANCRSLYAKVASCYNMTGMQKDQCFKRIAGFVGQNIKNQSANNKEALRNYLIFLLYNLQEKVEESFENNRTNSTQASETISLIVEIKQDILLGKKKADIRPKLERLKTMIRELNI